MSDVLDQIRTHLQRIASGETVPPEGTTHLMELSLLMREGLGELALTESVGFTADSLQWLLKFADRKVYEVTIKEVRSEKPKTE